jgi:hypothetical protein
MMKSAYIDNLSSYIQDFGWCGIQKVTSIPNYHKVVEGHTIDRKLDKKNS